MDVVLAIDASGSVGLSNFESCLKFAKDIVHSFDTDTGNVRVGMMTFDGTSNIIFHLNANMSNSNMKREIEKAYYTGRGTDIKQALETIVNKMFVEKNGDRRDIKNVIFLLTDGESISDPIPAAETAHKQGITINVLGVGSGTCPEQLKGMASKPTTDHLFQKSSFGDLSDYGSAIAAKLCQACSVLMDVVLAIDASGSVGRSNFESCLKFAKDIVGSFDTDTGNVRVGMMTFDTASKIIFHLNANMSNSDMKKVIGKANYTGRGTDIKQALEMIVNKMFVEKNGDRGDIKNVIFLLTDGKSESDPIPAAETAHKQGVTINVLGVGSETSPEQLRGMASKPTTNHLFQKNSFGDLSDYGSALAAKICQACSVSMDVVLAIDASGSVGRSNFESCLKFAEDIVGSFDTDTGNVRVGMMTFDTASNIIFHLNANMRNSDIKKDIGKANYTGRGTDIKQALETIVNKMFVENNGDRRYIDNVIFLLTDGVSGSDPIPAAETAHKQGITINVLGVGSHTSSEQLRGMASKPTTDHLFQKSSFGNLSDYGSVLAAKICQVVAASDKAVQVGKVSSSCSNEVVAASDKAVKNANESSPCSNGDMCRFALQRGYMLPFKNNSLTINIGSLADCISLCIGHLNAPSKCEAFNFCKPDDKLSGSCQIVYQMEEWQGKLIANSSCVFATPAFDDV